MPGLSDANKAKVNQANNIMRRTYDLAIACILNRVPFVMENPLQSLMWATDELQCLLRLPGVQSHRFDFCQYGEEYQKATKLVSYGYDDVDSIRKVCRG